MKKIRAICLFMGLLLLLGSAFPTVSANTVDQSVVSGCHSPDAAMQLSNEKKLVPTAKAVILYELKSDTLIYAWKPDQRIYPASMVKLMTALIALERGTLSDQVTVTKRAISNIAMGSVSAGLEVGEVLSLESLLYCMMTASANDAAAVIAEHIAGSQEDFVDLMNEKAQLLGCVGTHYGNVHGLHDEQTYTTARDICRILDIALDIPQFRTFFSAETYTVPATNKSEERVIYTSNDMMRSDMKRYYDERITGGKTGSTTQAGRCLAVTAEGNGMEVLSIVMGAEPVYAPDGLSLITFGSYEETTELLNYTMQNFAGRQIFYDGQVVAQYPVEDGANSVLVQPQQCLSSVLPIGVDESKLTWIYGNNVGTIHAPVEKGQVITQVQVWYGAKCLAQTDLVAVNAVSKWEPPIDGKVEVDDGKVLYIILGIVGALLLIGVVVIFSLKARSWIYEMRAIARHRRRRIGRRRSR